MATLPKILVKKENGPSLLRQFGDLVKFYPPPRLTTRRLRWPAASEQRRVIKETRILLSSRASEELSGHIIGLSRPCGHPRNYAGQAPPFAPETVMSPGAKSFAVNYFKWLVGGSTVERAKD